MRVELGRLKQRALALVVGTSLLGGLLSGGMAAPAAATHGPMECPPIMMKSEIQKGMIATGYTVYRGRDPVAFEVEILGILRDGIGPGRDMIIVDTSGAIIDEAGGIWAGMSGSPVYYNDTLMGAVAYGLSYGPSSIGGLTPAQDMVDVLQYPVGGAPVSPRTAPLPRTVELSGQMREAIAEETGSSASEFSGDMTQLKMPVSVSGLSRHAMTKLENLVKREGLPFIPHAGSSGSSAATAAAGSVKPGGNFAAALSYGDVTFAGVGTTTYVCQGMALAFGHPFMWDGNTTLGANDADALVIVDDPLFGPYKLANIEERVGVVDQDRYAAIRALLGAPLETTPITAAVSVPDTARSRTGTSEAVTDEYTPFVALIHLLANIDMLYDQIGEGSSDLAWTITGTRADGSPWALARSNRYISQYDISWESVFEMAIQLYTLHYNRFEEIGFSDIDITAEIDDEVKGFEISRLLASKDGTRYEQVRRIRVKRGRAIHLRVELTPLEDTLDARTVDLQVRVPRRIRGSDALVEVTSGSESDDIWCLLEGENCADETGNKIDSFDELLSHLENRPKNNELLARLHNQRYKVVSSDSEILDEVVTGRKRLRVRIVR